MPDLVVVERTVSNLHVATLAAKLEYEVEFNLTIVDNSCDEEWRRRIKSWVDRMVVNFPELNLRLLCLSENVGYGRGNNVVIEKSQSKYHLVINPDLFSEPDSLCKALAFMELNSDVGLLSPSVYSEDGVQQFLCKNNPTLLIMFLRGFVDQLGIFPFRSVVERYELKDMNYDEVIDGLQYPSGCFMFFRTEYLQKIKGFDPDYFLHYEDADIGRRMLQIARVVYVPSVKVVHMWARDTHLSWKIRMITVRSGLIYWRKWGGIFKSMDSCNYPPQNLVSECKVKGESSQRILLTGATGFVGKALHTELISQGHTICAATRADKYKRNNVVGVGVVDDTTDWSKALRDVNTVIHLAARVHVMKDSAPDSLAAYRQVNVAGTLNLARQATQAGVKRFIFISSSKVNGDYSEIGQPFTEECVANPQDAYGQSKLEAEQDLLLLAKQTAMEVVIIRPPLVYGNGVKANFYSLLRIVRLGIPLPLGAIHNKRSFVYIGNLVSFILRCLDHPSAVGQVFMVSDGLDLSTTELIKKCAVALGVKSMLWPAPQRLIENLALILGKDDEAQRLCGSLQVDISKARALLGWTPPFSVEDGLKATALGLKGD